MATLNPAWISFSHDSGTRATRRSQECDSRTTAIFTRFPPVSVFGRDAKPRTLTERGGFNKPLLVGGCRADMHPEPGTQNPCPRKGSICLSRECAGMCYVGEGQRALRAAIERDMSAEKTLTGRSNLPEMYWPDTVSGPLMAGSEEGNGLHNIAAAMQVQSPEFVVV